jgi:mannose-6-phosphate isomerase-like protein (cupin superfamily)
MKRGIFLTGLCLALFTSSVWAGPVAGNPALLDTKYTQGILVNLDDWFAAHPVTTGGPSRADVIFESPRVQVLLANNSGPQIGLHYHQSADEIILVYKGQGEMYIGGQWVPVKAGDVHVNPRGVLHGVRVVGDEDLQFLSIYSPPQAGGNDKVLEK